LLPSIGLSSDRNGGIDKERERLRGHQLKASHQIDANRTGEPPALQPSSANIIRPPPEANQVP
jgi:hypothetical protein